MNGTYKCGAGLHGTYDNWKTTDPTDCPSVEDECPKDCEGCPTCKGEEPCPATVRSAQDVFHDEFMSASPEHIRVVNALKAMR